MAKAVTKVLRIGVSMDKFITKAEVERTEKGLVAVASTAVEDRHGEKVSQDGWDIKNFKKNPVLQWAHNHEIPAVGIAQSIKVEGKGKDARLTFKPLFHDLTPEAKALKAMYEGTDAYPPILNSFSVGFRPIDMDGNTYTKQELLEISAVNVPANPEARTLAYKSLEAQGFDKDVIKSVVGEESEDTVVPVDVSKDTELAELKQKYDELQAQLEDVVKGLKHLNPRGRKEDVIQSRLSLLKVVARANDKLLSKEVIPAESKASLLKIVKRANERLIVDHKEELNNG